jgi:hypothetical protein
MNQYGLFNTKKDSKILVMNRIRVIVRIVIKNKLLIKEVCIDG